MSSGTAVYRLYDRLGVSLYIGMSDHPEGRFAAHAARSWWPDVDHARTRIDWYPSRTAAHRAEVRAIRAERPAHNIRHVVSAEASRLQDDAVAAFCAADEALRRAWLLAGWAHAIGVPMEDLAEQTGRSRATLFRHAKRPDEAERLALVAAIRGLAAVSVAELVSEPFDDPA